MYKFSSLLCGLLLIAVTHLTQAQSNVGVLPYSSIGIGETNEFSGNIRNFGMGSIGVSTPGFSHVQVVNPALLFYNSRVTFEMVATGQVKNIAKQDQSQNTSSAGLGYLALSAPILKYWRAGVGLRPYSSVDYNSSTRTKVANDPNNTEVLVGNSGEGNLSEAYFSNGFKIYKGLTAGFTASYIFGVIDKSAYSAIVDNPTPEYLVVNDRNNISDFTFKSGLAYRHALGKKLNVNVGGVYGFQSDLSYDRRVEQQRRSVADNSLLAPPVALDSTKSTVTMPSFWQAGISFDNNSTWVAGMEFSTKAWSNYRGFNSANLADSYKFAVGSEYTPNPGAISYMKRITYRAGFSYRKTPYEIAGNQLDDVSLSAGLTLPIGATPRPPEYNQSFINLGIAVGRQGTTDNNLIRENYIRFMLGLSLNNSWFIRPKFD